MSNTVDARALRAAGTPITLLDGREVRLLFDLDAIAQVEEDFGSLGGMQDALQRIEKEGVKSQFFKPVLQLLRASLLHDPTARDAKFDTAEIGTYFKAVMEATQLAFPKDLSVNGVPTPAPMNTTPASPGTPSITPPQSNIAEPMSGSGG